MPGDLYAVGGPSSSSCGTLSMRHPELTRPSLPVGGHGLPKDLHLRHFCASCPDPRLAGEVVFFLLQSAAEVIQLNGRIRRSRVRRAFPRQPQFGLVQERSSFPNIFIACASESDALSHFLCRLIL